MTRYLQHHFFELSADKNPQAVCLAYNDQSVTYQELDQYANRVAHMLLDMGVRPNDRVCLLSHKEIALYGALLGTLKAGGCWVPFSESMPMGRIKALLETLKPKAILVDKAHINSLDEDIVGDIPVINVDDVAQDCSFPQTRPQVQISTSDLAYIIFTSGSTGTPKGVKVSHGSTAQFLNHADDYFDIVPGAAFAHFSEISFDPSILDLFVCWTKQGILKPFHKRSYKVNPYKFFEDYEVNVIFTVPNVFEKIIDTGKINEDALSHLKHILLTGEAVKLDLVHTLYKAIDGVKIYNMYGTTETAIISHWCVIPPDCKKVPVGYVMPGMRVDLIDEQGKISDHGESVVSSGQISAGYWDNKFLTEQKFKSHPHYAHITAYFTGDMLSRDENGLYYFEGRVDDQIKIRGNRVEIGEVEAALCQNERIFNVCVVAHSQSGNAYDQQLFAFVESDEELDLLGVKQDVSKILPAFMMPSHIVRLSNLPRNANGKIDKQALKQKLVQG